MKMKYLLATGLCLLLGCTTAQKTAWINTAAAIAGTAAEWAVLNYPAQRGQFAAAAKAIGAWLDTGRTNAVALDPSRLTDILSTLSLGRSGWGPEGELYLQAGLVIWNAAAGVNYVVTSQPAVAVIAGAIRDGFERGLAQPTAGEWAAKNLETTRRGIGRPGRRVPL